MRTGSRRHRISTVFQIPGRRADSVRIGLYTNFLDTTVWVTWKVVAVPAGASFHETVKVTPFWVAVAEWT